MNEYEISICFIVDVDRQPCSGQRNQKTEESNVAPPTFEMVSVPTLITDPVERAEYLVKHYWDKFDFKDTTYIHEPQVPSRHYPTI